MPQKMIDAFEVAQPGDLADRLRVDAADRRHPFRRERLHVLRERFVAGGAIANDASSARPSSTITQHRVEQRHIGVGVELQVVGGVPGRRCGADRPGSASLPTWRHSSSTWRRPDDSVGLAPMTKITSGASGVAHLVGDRAGIDAFHQRGNARRIQARSDRRCWTRSRCAPAWNRYASSFVPLAEPKPASDRLPWVSRVSRRPFAARSSASSQVASRKLAASCRDRRRNPCAWARPACGRAAW